VKVGREDIFKPTTGKDTSHEISNDVGVRVVKFAIPRNLFVKSTMFPHCSIHKYTWTSPEGKTPNQIDHVLIDCIKVYLMSHVSEGPIKILTTIW
jgi:hypothetical protein